MPKRIKHKKRRRAADVNKIAHTLVQQSTTAEPAVPLSGSVPPVVSEYMATIGRKGGKIGGKRRLTTLTKDERKKMASEAAKVRWGKAKPKK